MKKIAYSMIPKQLHLVVTGETGAGLSFVVRRDHVAIILAVTLSTLTALAVGTWLGIGFFQEKILLPSKPLFRLMHSGNYQKILNRA